MIKSVKSFFEKIYCWVRYGICYIAGIVILCFCLICCIIMEILQGKNWRIKNER